VTITLPYFSANPAIRVLVERESGCFSSVVVNMVVITTKLGLAMGKHHQIIINDESVYGHVELGIQNQFGSIWLIRFCSNDLKFEFDDE
jgi:hypothetical protein